MKIAIFTEVYHPTINGVVISIDRFKNELQRLGHEVMIFAPENSNSNRERGVFRAHSIPLPTNKDYFFTNPGEEGFDKLKNFKPDIIHTQHMFRMGWFGLRTGKKLNIPVVHTYHTLIADQSYIKHIPFFGYFPLTAFMIRKLLISQTLKYANAVDLLITPSNPMAQVLKSYKVKKKVNVLPTGIDFDLFHNVKPIDIYEKFKIDRNKKIIVFIGRIAKEKNINLLLNSFIQLKNKFSELHLLFLGAGPDQKHFEGFVSKNNLFSDVTFAGFVAPLETPGHLKLCTLLAFPSITETQGLVIAEAMAAGLPVVASNRMGQTDIIQKNKNGLLPSPDVNSFKQAIENLLENNEMQKDFIQEGYKTARELSASSQAKKLLKLYRGTIDRKKKIEYN